ncbi:M20 metallopeptidase family protein [Fundicoccus culcitae]|uniref:Amidohydrolase n=1 Tax=Fundicoccus culcitae TaxID=2969821 RepID=A0ABY5P4W8_9LACT|nr:amidohydrolase [Fundicoccus culcitae]UUX33788.1 amidohydrolase [Fundicoccus culcitae]
MSLNETILALLDQYNEEAIEVRHYLHRHPELSSKEFETSKYLKAFMTNLGYEIEAVEPDEISAGTGFTATLDTGRPGKTIGLRADIDALPVQETERNLANERIVRSENDGVMHACGHDGHMTTLLYAAKILKQLEDKLSGKVIFIFEEAEETNDGLPAMLRHLEGRGIDAIYGNHLAAFLESGKVSADPGPVMAAAAVINFEVVGKGGHGSRPDLAVNPLFAGVDILNSINIAWNNQINVEETVTLGLTQFHVGELHNVFADRAKIGGTLRYFNVEEGTKAYNTLMKVANGVAAVHNCTIVEAPSAGPATIPVINDEALAAQVKSGVEELFPGHLAENVKWYASESFSHFSKIAPSVFSFIGTKNEELGSGAEHHNEYFDIDDASLRYGIGTMVKFTVDNLAN